MRRREFIAGLGSAVAWPAAAQQGGRVRRVGVLISEREDDPEAKTSLSAFTRRLAELGWTDDSNLRIDYRTGRGDADLIRRYAAELLALTPEVVLATAGVAVAALRQATRTVPIVFIGVIDPVGAGFVASLARPGGNATEYGLSGKWLALLKEIAPSVTRAAVLRDPAVASGIGQFAAVQAVAPSLGVELRPIDARDAPEIERAVTAFARSGNSGLIVTPSPVAGRPSHAGDPDRDGDPLIASLKGLSPYRLRFLEEWCASL